jgi:hypothetical protein
VPVSGEFETCPIWGPSVDRCWPSTPIILKTLGVARFDQSANWTAKVRNVSRLGSQFKVLYSQATPRKYKALREIAPFVRERGNSPRLPGFPHLSRPESHQSPTSPLRGKAAVRAASSAYSAVGRRVRRLSRTGRARCAGSWRWDAMPCAAGWRTWAATASFRHPLRPIAERAIKQANPGADLMRGGSEPRMPL